MRGLAQSITRILREPGREWIAVEPNPPLVDRIRQWVGETPDSGLSAVTGTIADFPVNESFDSILYIDVLEHIEDDRGVSLCCCQAAIGVALVYGRWSLIMA